MLKITRISASIEGKKILKDVSLEIGLGEVVAVMGPNGSGKSTLAAVVAGHPKYTLDSGKMELDGHRLEKLEADGRANLGLYLASQYPVAVPGLTTQNFLWQLYKKRNKEKKMGNVMEFRKWLQLQVKLLELKPELLTRGLNDGFSGGEKKKLEVLQMLVFNPQYVILDEIDSGLDVDALSKIAKTVAKMAKSLRVGVLVITHYQRILEYLQPNRVVVMKAGEIVERGGIELVNKIEKKGFCQ